VSCPASRRSWVILLFLVTLVTMTWAQRGVLTAKRDLAQLTTAATTIVRGRVVLARVEPHPKYSNLPTVVVVMRADEVMKGAPERTFTFRQFIFDIRDRRNAAGYRKGDEYLLLMNAPNRLGLSSPVGLEQGRFRIVRRNGKAVAVNGHNNRGLLEGAAVAEVARSKNGATLLRAQAGIGPIALDDLRAMIRQISSKP
jgi:hypothetical protein